VVAFVFSILVMIGIVAITMRVGRRRPVGAPLTWGEAMAAGTFAFFAMFVAYGLVPHLWLTWADSELKWRPDVLLSDYPFWGIELGFLAPVEAGGVVPLTISMATVRDLIAVLIHVALLVGQVWLWAWWQKRGRKPTTELVTSDYGRPLVKRA
jgi:hypothetical protein